MWGKLQKLLDRLESRIALWAAVSQAIPVVGVGAISAWLSTGVDWISNFGWFGWWMAGLAGIILALFALLLFALLRNAWTKSLLMRKWSREVDSINPLDSEFTRKRIRLGDIANPYSKSIEGKRFIDCELNGPANIVLRKDVSLNGLGFWNCDFVVLANKPVPINNVIVLDDVQIIGGKMWECTILIPPQLVPMIGKMGVSFITLTGIAAIDAPVKGGPSASGQS